ncbi:hypothetical protein [Bacteroidetes bacterium endosymbiont of Geopemphigus sp.]|uniref:hypothetical protein n=1 Tax=Bacteroidetes bacterium endosymbiont of Geopemphigus sp. TaxID=2047937 RepID=UPI000CD04D1A|nr:hypothetical protein [Bacteroidetes bacterium endosymbiont of Geopemphigus sp.]
MKNFYAFSVGAFFIALSLMSGFYLGRYTDWVITNKKKVTQVSYSDKEQKIKRFLSFIETKYIKEVNRDRIINKTIQHVIGQLEIHTALIFPKKSLIKLANFSKKNI